MDVIASHRQALKWATELLEMTMADVTEAQLNWQPPGTANPLGATYAHAVCGIDAVVNGILAGQAPLFEADWAGRSGVSEPQHAADPAWARRVRVDLAAARPYAGAVYAAADEYIAGLSAADLDRELDLTPNGLGVQSLDWCLSALVTAHVNNMAGEISCLKGLQGGKGYPF